MRQCMYLVKVLVHSFSSVPELFMLRVPSAPFTPPSSPQTHPAVYLFLPNSFELSGLFQRIFLSGGEESGDSIVFTTPSSYPDSVD